MLENVVCALGKDACRVFYEPDRFTRRDAMPKSALRLLQDAGSVATLDGSSHRHRKGMFMSFMTPDAGRSLADEVRVQWRAALTGWEALDELVLFDEVENSLCRAVCRWSGIPASDSAVERRTRELHAMIDGAGTIGPRNWRGQVLRIRTERWAQELIRQARAGRIRPREGAPLQTLATHRDVDGELLDTDVAAVELINVLRPTVAVAYFITFGALALRDQPQLRDRLKNGEENFVEPFVHEVRRAYPFFPFVAGRVKTPFEWRGRRFDMGTMMLLDLYGTNHDSRIWDEPETFRPERFDGWEENACRFIPQGGGDHFANHRCAGEWVTIEILKTAMMILAEDMEYDVPEQDLRVRLSRMPTLPESRFVIRNVRSPRK